VATTAGMLAEVPLFSLMDEDERALLAERMEPREVSKGETIFSRGDVGDSLVIVTRGRVQIFVESMEGNKIILGEVEPSEMLGEITLFDPGPRSATAVAVEDTELLVLEHEEFWQVLQRKPHMALDLLAVMGKRLRATDELLRTQATRNLNEVIEVESTLFQRAADVIAEFSGSMPFLAINFFWFAVWIAVNTIPLGVQQFDPFPFGLLTLIVSLEAIFLSIFVLVSQNRQSERERIRTDFDHQVNVKAHLAIVNVIERLDRIERAVAGTPLRTLPRE